jgi:hypothetical protein
MTIFGAGSVLSVVSSLCEQTLTLLLLLRFGILSLVTTIFVSTLLQQAPLTADVRAWYASGSLLLTGAIIAFAILACRWAVGRRAWMPDELL